MVGEDVRKETMKHTIVKRRRAYEPDMDEQRIY